MSDKVFLDTNVVLYSYSEDEPEKQEIENRLTIINPFKDVKSK
jgi:predicted nucleic acid-binding protein